jgi:hypothetical protein
MNIPGSSKCDEPIRVMVAADGDSAARLASVLAGDYVHVVAIAELDDNVAESVQHLDPDVLVLAGGASMATARAVAEAVAATASRVTVMIVDDAGPMADTRVFWPKDRTYRTASAVEPPPFPLVDLLACA